MRPYHRVNVQLSQKDHEQLSGRLRKGKQAARVLRRAWVLQQLEQGQKAAPVAGHLAIASKTVRAIARRYEEEGLEQAL